MDMEIRQEAKLSKIYFYCLDSARIKVMTINHTTAARTFVDTNHKTFKHFSHFTTSFNFGSKSNLDKIC